MWDSWHTVMGWSIGVVGWSPDVSRLAHSVRIVVGLPTSPPSATLCCGLVSRPAHSAPRVKRTVLWVGLPTSPLRATRKTDATLWSHIAMSRYSNVLLLAAICSGHPAALAADLGPTAVTATFSIVAVDPESGTCGAAVASKYPAVGRVVPYVRAGVGAFCTQHYHVPSWGELALDRLQSGKQPAAVLAELLEQDAHPDQRQLAIIDASGRSAIHNPIAAPPQSRYWGAMTGKYFCCQGNTLAGRKVIVEMAKAFEDTSGNLTDRLVAALVAGDRAGGDHRGRLAAGVRVAEQGVEGYAFELYVDKSDDAVEELARRYAKVQKAP